MSSAMYNKMWHQTQDALNSLLDKESQRMKEPQRNQVLIFQMLATFYIKYVQIFRSLETVYDQMVHPQKRALIRRILDGVMGRILELKNEMVELELTEFHYFDDILQNLKLAPQQLDIPIPKYFLKEKLEVIKGREKILAQILANAELRGPREKSSVKSLPLEQAVKTIQVAERARQGRLRAMLMKQIFLQEFRTRQARLLGEKVADTGVAALRIQKVWRGFRQSKKTEREREEEMVFLGMNPPPLFNEVSATIVQAEKVTYLRNEVQIKHEEDYREAMVSIKDDLKLTEGLDIKENLQDQIRHWFIECRNLTGTFPDFPNAEEGGSAVLFSNKTPQQIIDDIIASQEEEEKNKKKKKKKKEKKEKKAKKLKEKKEPKDKVKCLSKGAK
uniref:IQ motif containing with AAA domain 1 n=1 Tax=Molossus molossus TaxID=27622 RepID=A0A7J8FT47_MOLMO|nr:IQ motif containing with AAA domain 1 [Molossus molossus]